MLQVRRPRRGRGIVPRAEATEVHGSLTRDGYAIAVRVVGDDVLERARAHLETLPGDAMRAVPIAGDALLSDVAAQLVPLACEALDADAVECFGATYIVKPAHVGLPTRWHQDGHPWEQRGIMRAVSIGIALDDATLENGCLLVIPGSHELAAQPLRAVTEPANVFGVEIDPALVDESRAVAVELRAGDASIHHPNVIHGAAPNRSDRPRRTLVLRYHPA